MNDEEIQDLAAEIYAAHVDAFLIEDAPDFHELSPEASAPWLEIGFAAFSWKQ